MADPVIVDIPKGSWKVVATNVTTGQVHKLFEQPNEYLHTYRMTGNPAPSNKNEGIAIFVDNELTELISSVAAIDVYIWCVEENGRVRVDL